MISDLDEQYKRNNRYDAEEAIIEYGDKFAIKKKVWYWFYDGAVTLSVVACAIIILAAIIGTVLAAGIIVAKVFSLVVLSIILFIAVGYAWNEIVPRIPDWIE